MPHHLGEEKPLPPEVLNTPEMKAKIAKARARVGNAGRPGMGPDELGALMRSYLKPHAYSDCPDCGNLCVACHQEPEGAIHDGYSWTTVPPPS